MLYTGKGDNGKTGLFGCNQKFSKSSGITEALGSLDEVNSYIGIVKSKVRPLEFGTADARILETVQNNLFIIQAQIAGADKKVAEHAVKELEDIINSIEKKLPPIKSFLISGTTEISAHFDFARTLVRRAERRIVALSEGYPDKIDPSTLAYINRLSSVMYAYARLFALEYFGGKDEQAPTY